MSCEPDGTKKKSGPACDECGGSTDTVERWNGRPVTETSRTISVDIGAAAAALEASPELCAMMIEMVGGPALAEAQSEIDRLRKLITDAIDEYPVASGLYVDSDGQDGYGSLKAMRVYLEIPASYPISLQHHGEVKP